MTEPNKPRSPEAFTLDDPNLELTGEAAASEPDIASPKARNAAVSAATSEPAEPAIARGARASETARRGIRWGAILLAAASALASAI